MAINTPDEFSISIASTREAMARHADAWDGLSRQAAEGNINYEREPFFALLDATGETGVSAAFIWLGDLLCGFWPLHNRRDLPLPVNQISTYYDSSHMMSSVPLLRAGYEAGCIDTLLNWVHRESGAALFSFQEVTAKSAIAQQIDNAAVRLGFSCERFAQSERAVLTASSQSFTDYYAEHTSSKRRNGIKRKRKKLAALGDWRVRCFAPSTLTPSTPSADFERCSDWRPLLNDLIDVEAKSWKAAHGSAIACNAPIRHYTLQLCEHAAKHDRLYLIAADLGGVPIAAQLGLINDHDIMIYKLGFDESHKAHSPGLLLTYDMIAQIMDSASQMGIDSCGDPSVRLYSETLHHRRAVWKTRYAIPQWHARALHGSLRLVRSCVRTARQIALRDAVDGRAA